MKKASFFLIFIATLSIQPNATAEPAMMLDGIIEVEALSRENTRDIAVATIEIGLAARINEKVSGEVVLLYEEDETDLNVDSAAINLDVTESLRVTTGLIYLPFGTFGSYMISDPLTLELAETSATALLTGITTGPLTASVYTFNGVNADENLDNWGANLAYNSEYILLTLGYLANMGDTDTISAESTEMGVPGISLSAGINAGRFSLIAEYISALNEFQIGDGNADYQFTTEARPLATNLELAYSLGDTTLAIGVQNTNEAEELGLAKSRNLVTVSHELMENTSLALEWAREKDYAGHSSEMVTAQLAVKF